ncbi:GATA-4/5/6 transcription factor [Paramicrosporidium saccamoebae]|uniref:GATA-4/5/6 transcription factor n=1 Tax=Paramicrosporidium saccamoebae TaxID=1246581 RepID=A0A2H9TGT3_9FUNG|nr:GATA-4/5/6 transcription factor [Paramicrosporidium saccamoebae]
MNHALSDGSTPTLSPKRSLESDDMPDITAMLSAKRSRLQQDEYHGDKTVHEIQLPESPPKQFTWVMESGRAENVAESGRNFPMMNSAALPLHFQHLLAASSLLWNPYDTRNAVFDHPVYSSRSYDSRGGYDRVPFGNPAFLQFPMLNYSGKKCSNCSATSTPSWRRCPAGKNLLCNACGLYQKLHNKPRPFRVADDGSIRVQRSIPKDREEREGETLGKICANCGTSDTPLWRKVDNILCCNACALFYKTHRVHRKPNSASPRD